MIFEYTERFLRSYNAAPATVQKACNKQLLFLLNDLRHPSLHAKKYDETNDVWQARINDSWRLYFTISADTYTLVGMIPHPK